MKKSGIKQTQDEFISNARCVHGDKYDYSLVRYVNSKTKVKIICPDHGEFLQAPIKHLSGQKCKHCNKHKIGHEEYLIKFKEMKEDGFGILDLPDKINARTYIDFRCCECEEVYSRRASRIYHEKDKLFCRKCSSVRQKLSKEEYLKRFNTIFGDKYNFDKINTDGNCFSKVTVVCQKHGDFSIRLTDLLKGSGCRQCYLDNNRPDNPTQAERYKDQYLSEYCCVYLLDFDLITERFKVGITKDKRERFGQLRRCHGTFEVVDTIDTNRYNAIYIEDSLLKLLEPFRLSGLNYTEVFEISKEGFHVLREIFTTLKERHENTA